MLYREKDLCLFSDPRITHKCIVGRTLNFSTLKLVLHQVIRRL